MGDVISIREIFDIFRNRWKLIIFCIFLCGLISGIISYYVLKPVYQSSTQILVNQKTTSNTIDMTQIKNNIDLINTYSVIIKSPIILDKVIKELSLTQDIEQLNRQISINIQDNSQVFTVTVEDQNPNQAVLIANTVSDIFKKEIFGIMSVDNVNILAKAKNKSNPVPIKPNPVLNMTIGIIIGIVLGGGWSILLASMDNTIKTTKDVEELLDVPLLGSISSFTKNKIPKNQAIKQRRGEDFGA